ncbi:hypothetical protein TNCV_4759401 [Trichonephila clavipes]|nr:hypothetical protein TNCV_4759401 [Trichonephila clavipes]
MHHKVSHGGLHRNKREAYITKRRITTQTSLSYPGFESRPTERAVRVHLQQLARVTTVTVTFRKSAATTRPQGQVDQAIREGGPPHFSERDQFYQEAMSCRRVLFGKKLDEESGTSLVYADKPQTLDHLEDRIRRVIADIRPQMLEKVIENWTSKLDYIRASRGSPMPEIIFKT